MRIEALADSAEADREAVRAMLAAANAEAGHPHAQQVLLIALRDAGGSLQGGAIARIAWRWLFVETLAVAPALRGRGWGARLLRAAEREARARGCVGARLDTYSFQARGFYEKQGYGVAGAISDCPPGQTRYTMFKRLHEAQGETA